MKLMLGSAQFGLNYGVANRSGRPSSAEVARILKTARKADISYLDTANLYGDSEAVLGALSIGCDFNIVTKTPHLDTLPLPVEQRVQQSLQLSLQRLGCSMVYGVLVHRVEELLGDNGDLYYRQLKDMQRQGLIGKIGASVYDRRQIESLMERYSLDLIQLPINLLDQRLECAGTLKSLRQAGVEIHARSVYLQGVLLMDPDSLPAYFQPIRPHLSEMRRDLEEQGVSPMAAALAYVDSLPEVDRMVLGCDSAEQLRQTVDVYVQAKGLKLDFSKYALADSRFLNPAQWEFA